MTHLWREWWASFLGSVGAKFQAACVDGSHLLSRAQEAPGSKERTTPAVEVGTQLASDPPRGVRYANRAALSQVMTTCTGDNLSLQGGKESSCVGPEMENLERGEIHAQGQLRLLQVPL